MATNIGLKEAFINYLFKYPVSYAIKAVQLFFAQLKDRWQMQVIFSCKKFTPGLGMNYIIKAYDPQANRKINPVLWNNISALSSKKEIQTR